MKTAKEMFEELGYYLQNNTDCEIEFMKNDVYKERIKFIKFYLGIREYTTYSTKVYENAVTISTEELKAINKQVEELGWLE